MFRIFIGWDSRFPEPGEVLRHSLLEHASIPLDVRFLKLGELSFNRPHDPLQSTEFTYTRFLVPNLCDFEGTALFLDNDMLCLGDVKEIADLDMSPYALRVVKHDHQPAATVKMYGCTQTSYPRKNWSSMMLMDCAKLKLWTQRLVETQTGAYLHRFQDIADSLIGELPKTWNTLDSMDRTTKLIHWTSGGPWFEQTRNCPHADVWLNARDQWRASLSPPPRPKSQVIAPHVGAGVSPLGSQPVAR